MPNKTCTNITGTFNFCFPPRNNGTPTAMNHGSDNGYEIMWWIGAGVAAGIAVLLIAVSTYQMCQRRQNRHRSALGNQYTNESGSSAGAELSDVVTAHPPEDQRLHASRLF